MGMIKSCKSGSYLHIWQLNGVSSKITYPCSHHILVSVPCVKNEPGKMIYRPHWRLDTVRGPNISTCDEPFTGLLESNGSTISWLTVMSIFHLNDSIAWWQWCISGYNIPVDSGGIRYYRFPNRNDTNQRTYLASKDDRALVVSKPE